MKTRSTYIQKETLNLYPQFLWKKEGEVMNSVKGRCFDYSIISIIKLLDQLRQQSSTFSALYSKSQIRMKKSFLNYLHLCIDLKFVRKESIGRNMVYHITDKGKELLRIFLP